MIDVAEHGFNGWITGYLSVFATSAKIMIVMLAASLSANVGIEIRQAVQTGQNSANWLRVSVAPGFLQNTQPVCVAQLFHQLFAVAMGAHCLAQDRQSGHIANGFGHNGAIEI